MAKTHRKKGGYVELPQAAPYEPPKGTRSAECQLMVDFCSLCGGTGLITTPTGECRGRCPHHPELGDDVSDLDLEDIHDYKIRMCGRCGAEYYESHLCTEPTFASLSALYPFLKGRTS